MKISEDELRKDLKRVGDILGKPPTGVEYEQFGKYSVFPFKSKKPWNKWLQEIFEQVVVNKNKYERRDITFEELKRDLKKLEFLGHKPTRREYEQHGKYSSEIFYKFMNWKEWQDLCFPHFSATNSMKFNYNNTDLVRELKRVSDIIGNIPSLKQFTKHGKILWTFYLNIKPWSKWQEDVFGTSNKKPNKISDIDLVNNLIEIKNKLGRTPTKMDLSLKNGSKYSINAYKRAFGNLANALLAAGMQPNQIRGLLKEDYIKELRKIYIKLGHTPSINDFNKTQTICSAATIYNAFGSWTEALRASNIPIETARGVSQQDVLTALQNWYEKNNKDVNCLEYWKIRKARDRREFPYSCVTIKNKFNLHWEEIMQKIDVNYFTRNPFICRGTFEGNDGYNYLSSIEREVGDILFELKTLNQISSYEYEAPVCQEKTWTCDFLVNGEIWLEVDGMRNNRHQPYNSGDNEKIEYYKQNNLNYEVISYVDDKIRETLLKILEII